MVDEAETAGEIMEDVEAIAAEKPPITILRDPGCPTEAEKEEHSASHMPYRAWCPVCVQAKGKESPHRRRREDEVKELPTMGLDYKEFGESDTQDDKVKQIVMRDSRSLSTFSHVVE